MKRPLYTLYIYQFLYFLETNVTRSHARTDVYRTVQYKKRHWCNVAKSHHTSSYRPIRLVTKM